MASRTRSDTALGFVALGLSAFVLVEVNYPQLTPPSQLAIFALFGLALSFAMFPAARVAKGMVPTGWKRHLVYLDRLLIALTIICCGYIVVQSQPALSRWWLNQTALGDRAGAETGLDYFVGVVGVLLVLEATRRCLGWALPILATLFIVYASFGANLPDWLFPHRGYGYERIVAQTFIHSQGVFGIALRVMFSYVFLFVLLGALLEVTGATQFIVDFAQRIFRRSPGGAAKVAVLSSGMMGSLSGSAVANTATTGTFAIPLMTSIGFSRDVAAGITAAASSGGALVPPVMGAGAYMMLEIVTPSVTYLEIIKAALLPAVLYYMALFLIVHFYSQRLGSALSTTIVHDSAKSGLRWEGFVFAGTLGALILLLLAGYSVFRAVSLATGVVIVLSSFHRSTRIGFGSVMTAAIKTARGGAPLITAASSVGIVLGVVTLTGVGTKFPSTILALAGESLLLALILIMVGSIVLGMGLPSAVCYLLMATLIGPIIGQLGVVPLAAHLFIFYFGMMSMVTPPVALAAYTAASIADAHIMRASIEAFRFALVGFTLPFMFVFRPELLFLSADGSDVGLVQVALAFLLALAGVVGLAAAIAGYFSAPLGWAFRGLFLLAALLLFFPGSGIRVVTLELSWLNILGAVALGGGVIAMRWRTSSQGEAA